MWHSFDVETARGAAKAKIGSFLSVQRHMFSCVGFRAPGVRPLDWLPRRLQGAWALRLASLHGWLRFSVPLGASRAGDMLAFLGRSAKASARPPRRRAQIVNRFRTCRAVARRVGTAAWQRFKRLQAVA